MFGHPFPHAFGLDISDLSIKIVQLRNVSRTSRLPSYRVQHYRSMSLPHGVIVNGVIQEPEKLRKYMLHLIQGQRKKHKPIRGQWVVASVPETQSFIKLLTINKPPEDVIDDDIIDLAKRHIPFDEDDSFVDWQFIPQASDDTKTQVLIAASPQTIVRDYTYLLESLGLGVIALDPEALAISRSMITAAKEYKEEARALLDLGATRSSLIIYDNDTVQFSISLPYSGELITTDLSQQLHISYDEAEKKKIACGMSFKKDKENQKVWKIMTKHAERLAAEVQKAVMFYYSHFSDANKITHITMCGGGSQMDQLDKILSLKLKISCKPGHPWKNLALPVKKNAPKNELGYSTAIGLALRAADNPFLVSDIV